MNAPLDIIISNDDICVVRNGVVEQVRRPFLPFSLIPTAGGREFFELFERAPIQLGKVSFKSIDEKRAFAASHDGKILDMSYEDEILTFGRKFLERNAQTEPLRILALDIEVASDGAIFPSASRDPILCIGSEFEGELRIFGEGLNTLEEEHERAMLEEFSAYLLEKNPDIILGYNIKEFDAPYIYERCARWNINPNLRRHDCEDGPCCGRVLLDLLDSVNKDQSLYGIPNRRMKTVAKQFGLDQVIELPEDDIRHTRKVFQNAPRMLYDYLRSDVRITRALGKVYLPNILALSEMTGIPVNRIVEGHNSLIPKITHARELLSKGLIFLSRNIDRYPILEEAKFEAAYVDIFQTGKFSQVWKIDFAAQYPSTMITLNLSPETCRIESFESLSSQPVFRRDGSMLYLRIPDNNFKKDVCITVDMGREGFIRRNLIDLRTLRSALKKKMAETTDEDERLALNSQQTAVKVISNSTFGMAGLRYAQFSDLSIAIATVGTCRWLTRKVISWIEEDR